MKRMIISLLCLLWLPSLDAAELEASLHYGRVVELGLPVSGIVDKVHVSEGQRLKQGEPMLELVETPFVAELQQARASLRRLTAERAEVKKALDRNQELYERMVLPTVELDLSRLEYTRADSDVQSARARVALAEYHYEGSRLKAPFDGIVVGAHAYAGMAVRVEMKPPVLFVYADTSRLSAVAEVPADRLAGLMPGDRVEVRAGGQAYAARIGNLVLASEGRSLAQPSLYRVTAIIGQPPENLLPGMPAKIVTH